MESIQQSRGVRKEIERAILLLIRRGVDAPTDDAEFDRLARILFAYQYTSNAPYRRLCDSNGYLPDLVKHWTEIPPVTTAAFKAARLACFEEADTQQVFRTSGSTTEQQGELHLDTLELYEASLEQTFGAYVCPEGSRIRFMVLAPTLEDVADSSLSFMFDRAVQYFGTQQSRFYVGASGWNPEHALCDFKTIDEPVAVVGAAFSFVHLLDAFDTAALRVALPSGSRVMETGGFKGRSREIPRDELHGWIESRLGVPRNRIVNQYGMCELGSQFYEPSLIRGSATTTKRVPPWVRTRVVDPELLSELPTGDTGLLVHYDLANSGSVMAIQTSDLGRVHEDGFEILGRAAGAEAKGCSIVADQLMDR